MKKFTLMVGYCIFITLTVRAQWGLNGNAIAAANFLGSTNAQNLVFKCDGIISGYLDLSSNSNTFFGIGSGNPGGALYGNVAIGYKALAVNTAGNNTAIGTLALTANTSGDENTAVGVDALSGNTTGVSNTAVGPYQMMVNTTGSYNSSFGSAALSSNKTGTGNCAFGQQALNSNTASYNSAFGYLALDLNSTGTPNSAFGYYALVGNTTGSHNVAMGDSALATNTTGTENTAVGDYAGPSAAALTNTGAFGYGAQATVSNEILIGNTAVTKIGGYAAWTNFSDGRYKKNIQSNVPGLAFINKLNPVTYTLDVVGIESKLHSGGSGDGAPDDPVMKQAMQEKAAVVYTGFVAQEVEKAADSLNFIFSGVDRPKDVNSSFYGLRYSDFVPPLVKAVQELSASGNSKDSVIGVMQERLDSVEGKENVLVAEVRELKAMVLAQKGLAGASLEQNVPNPFNGSTVIGYTLPKGVSSAQMQITDATGKVLALIPLGSGGGKSTVTANVTGYASGTYAYSLIIDGKLAGTKQMLLGR